MKAKAKSRTEWARLVKEMEETGQDLRGFASAHDLNARTLAWWRTHLRRESLEVPKSKPASIPSQPAFARVTRAPAAERAPLRLEVGRVGISLTAGFDRDALVAVLQVLGVEEAR